MESTTQRLEKAALNVATIGIILAFITAFTYAFIVDSFYLQVALPIIAIVAGGLLVFAHMSARKSEAHSTSTAAQPQLQH